MKKTKATSQNRAPKYQSVNIDRILMPKEMTKLDEDLVADIAESMKLLDLWHPLAVLRRGDNFHLVAGAHRLEAAKRIGWTTIPCFFVTGDDRHAKLVRLGEDIFRKTTTVLRLAEKRIEYLHLASSKVNLSGQVGRKSKIGRPAGGVSLAARELSLVGRTAESRRHIVKRALKISRITPEAKKAAKKAGLDNNQDALLKIAAAGGQNSQLRLVEDIARAQTTVKSPQAKPANRRIPKKRAVMKWGKLTRDPTSYDDMVALWKSECSDGWAYLPSTDRERFHELLRRARQKAPTDIVEFIEDVLRGRGEVNKLALFGLADTKGISKAKLAKVIKERAYKVKRKGIGPGVRNLIQNPSRNWKDELSEYKDNELAEAAAKRRSDLWDTTAKRRKRSTPADYFDDV
jgi:ParB-like chromosome segregation protein Spo0J